MSFAYLQREIAPRQQMMNGVVPLHSQVSIADALDAYLPTRLVGGRETKAEFEVSNAGDNGDGIVNGGFRDKRNVDSLLGTGSTVSMAGGVAGRPDGWGSCLDGDGCADAKRTGREELQDNNHSVNDSTIIIGHGFSSRRNVDNILSDYSADLPKVPPKVQSLSTTHAETALSRLERATTEKRVSYAITHQQRPQRRPSKVTTTTLHTTCTQSPPLSHTQQQRKREALDTGWQQRGRRSSVDSGVVSPAFYASQAAAEDHDDDSIEDSLKISSVFPIGTSECSTREVAIGGGRGSAKVGAVVGGDIKEPSGVGNGGLRHSGKHAPSFAIALGER